MRQMDRANELSPSPLCACGGPGMLRRWCGVLKSARGVAGRGGAGWGEGGRSPPPPLPISSPTRPTNPQAKASHRFAGLPARV